MKDVLCVYDPDWSGVKFMLSWDHKSKIHFVRGTANSTLIPYCQHCLGYIHPSGACPPEGTYEDYVVERVMKS